MGKSVDMSEFIHSIASSEARVKSCAMTKHEVHARGKVDRCGYPVTRPERKTNVQTGPVIIRILG